MERRAQRRLPVLRHVEEVNFNVAATCRYYGISRQCYYGWLRCEADGLDGLTDRFSLAAHLAAGDSAGGDREDLVVAEALSLRPGEDRDVSGPVPRRDHLHLRVVADLGVAALPAPSRRWKGYEKQRPSAPSLLAQVERMRLLVEARWRRHGSATSGGGTSPLTIHPSIWPPLTSGLDHPRETVRASSERLPFARGASRAPPGRQNTREVRPPSRPRCSIHAMPGRPN